jgi:hypothetical protein
MRFFKGKPLIIADLSTKIAAADFAVEKSTRYRILA